jgi:P-type Cu+ transporter
MKKTFNIYGMHCAGCVNSAEKALKRVPGVISAEVQLTTEKAVVEFENNNGKFPIEELREAVAFAGFELEIPDMKHASYDVIGMHCAGCSSSVEKAMMHVEGVEKASVNLAAESAQIEYSGNDEVLEMIEKKVADLGYELKKKVQTI